MALIAERADAPRALVARHRRDRRPRRRDDRHARGPSRGARARRASTLRLAQVRGSVRDRMRRTGLMATIGEDHCYLSDEAAVAVPEPDGGGRRWRRPSRSDAALADVRCGPGGGDRSGAALAFAGPDRDAGHDDDRDDDAARAAIT